MNFENLSSKRICVIGDLIIDHYRILSAARLSPEAPVIICSPSEDEYRAGGAANVAKNLEAFGVGHVTLATVVGGKNWVGDVLSFKNPIFVTENARLTTIKERLVTRRQQLMRIDIQENRPISTKSASALVDASYEAIKASDCIIFSDYAHGVCTPDLIDPIMSLAIQDKKSIVVDSKALDTVKKYRGATIALPNSDEAKAMTRLEDFDDEHVANFLRKNMRLDAAAVTLGRRGIMLSTHGGTQIYPPLHDDAKTEVVDVTGAGDTVAAMIAACLCLNLPYDTMMRLANVAAGIKVRKMGVATVSPEEIAQVIAVNGLAI